MNYLEVKIVSPSGILFEDKCHMVIIPTLSGEIGVMSNHESLITSLKKGEIKILDESEKIIKTFKSQAGFVEMKEKVLLILID
jgi:F-type H+-transporting ATPase subunit epsilon